jgi:Zn-dependent protease with chaperone function
MSMDFFDREDHARRQTRRLLIMFTVAVVVIILAIYVAVSLIVGNAGGRGSMSYAGSYRDSGSGVAEMPVALWQSTPGPLAYLWNPPLLAGITLGTLVVVALGCLYKLHELSAGGEAVALMLGGRAVNPQTRDPAERRLLNVVEEMALASGIPVPPVYVLEHESGINAFAAGHQPGDAVVAVSAGALRYLTREELQGVMGHEFSHILNGDMRLNLRLIGIVYGILVLAVIGYYVMRSAGYVSRGSRKEQGGAAVVLFLLGLTFAILGSLGVFLGKLIKSAISRQREFLADASSVQFTRYPSGLAGALKKIGGLAEGSRIRDAHAEEISHMFFGSAWGNSFFQLFATHPPLAERIRRWEPDFDGHFPAVQPVDVAVEPVAERPRAGQAVLGQGGVPMASAAALDAAMTLDSGEVVARIGRPQTEHLDHATKMVDAMPPLLLHAAREPLTAQAVIYALLLSQDDDAARGRQLGLLQSQLSPHLYQQVQQLAAVTQCLVTATRLPLVDLTVPALKKCSPQQYVQFRQIMEAVGGADSKIDLFGYQLRIVLLSYLDVHFGLKPRPAIRYRTLDAVARPAVVVLSTLAYVGQDRPEDIQRAFQAGAQNLLGTTAILPREQCTLESLDAALAELAQASAAIKRDLITAVTACIAADGKVTIEESELLRAIAAVLACPVPPIAATATAA